MKKPPRRCRSPVPAGSRSRPSTRRICRRKPAKKPPSKTRRKCEVRQRRIKFGWIASSLVRFTSPHRGEVDLPTGRREAPPDDKLHKSGEGLLLSRETVIAHP